MIQMPPHRSLPVLSGATRHLRVLHLEHSQIDHRLTLAHLRHGRVEAQALRLESKAAFLRALAQDWDVVLSDYVLPGFSGMQALELLKASGKLIPFILISNEIGEDEAVAAMRNGASDCLLKSNLDRLVPALLRAIEAAETQRARRHADEELARSQQRLRELAHHLQINVEAERVAIAREIHDDVGGSLTAVKFDLAWIARHANIPVVAERALQALETVTQAIEASQRIMHNLRPAILEQGLVAALQWMTQRFEKRNGIATHFSSFGVVDTQRWPAGVALTAYRTAQEALTNISKHAQASRVEVGLTAARGVLSLEVSDNGRGLSQQDLAKDRSYGIRGLHERANMVGGWIDLTSGAGGTTLILSVPLRPGGRNQTFEASRPPADTQLNDPTAWGNV